MITSMAPLDVSGPQNQSAGTCPYRLCLTLALPPASSTYNLTHRRLRAHLPLWLQAMHLSTWAANQSKALGRASFG